MKIDPSEIAGFLTGDPDVFVESQDLNRLNKYWQSRVVRLKSHKGFWVVKNVRESQSRPGKLTYDVSQLTVNSETYGVPENELAPVKALTSMLEN